MSYTDMTEPEKQSFHQKMTELAVMQTAENIYDSVREKMEFTTDFHNAPQELRDSYVEMAQNIITHAIALGKAMRTEEGENIVDSSQDEGEQVPLPLTAIGNLRAHKWIARPDQYWVSVAYSELNDIVEYFEGIRRKGVSSMSLPKAAIANLRADRTLANPDDHWVKISQLNLDAVLAYFDRVCPR